MTTRRAPYAGWRAFAATVMLLAGAACAHTWAGGHIPHWSTLAGLGVVLHGSSLLVLRGHVSWKLLLPAVAAAQTVLHTSFVATATTHAGHLDDASGVAADPWTWQMLLAHAAVTLLTPVVWWACGRAATVVRHLLTHDTAYAGGRRVPRPAPRSGAAVRPRLRLADAPLRGPPAAFCTT